MSMTLLLAQLAVQSAAPQPAIRPGEASAPAPERKCMNARAQIATVLRKQVRPERLDRLPPGRLELTVVREVGGCVIPAVLRENIGR